MWFDCNVTIGKRAQIYEGSVWKKEDILAEMQRIGVDKALVSHAYAREYDAKTGNELLLQEISGCPQLVPAFVVMPHHTGEFLSPDLLLESMKKNNVRAVKMFPSATDHNYSLEDWCCGHLLHMLEKHKIPLFLGLDQTDFQQVHNLCCKYPMLPVVLTGVTYRIDRNLYPLMALHNNLYIESIGYKAHCGIEQLSSKFSSKRILFGSQFPLYSLAAAVGMVSYSPIPQQEKENIAGKNLQQLLDNAVL